MDISLSLLSSRFLLEVHTHAATLAVSPLRSNGLNDHDVCLPTIEYVLAHPERPGVFNIDAIAALPPDASTVDRYNHTVESADLLQVIQGVQVLKTYAL